MPELRGIVSDWWYFWGECCCTSKRCVVCSNLVGLWRCLFRFTKNLGCWDSTPPPSYSVHSRWGGYYARRSLKLPDLTVLWAGHWPVCKSCSCIKASSSSRVQFLCRRLPLTLLIWRDRLLDPLMSCSFHWNCSSHNRRTCNCIIAIWGRGKLRLGPSVKEYCCRRRNSPVCWHARAGPNRNGLTFTWSFQLQMIWRQISKGILTWWVQYKIYLSCGRDYRSGSCRP